MATPTQVPVSLVTLVLLIVPGLIGLEIYYRRSRKRREHSRVHWIVYSIFLSTASILLLYLTTGLYFDRISLYAQQVAQFLGLVSDGDLFALSVPVIASLYVLHISITIGVAYLAGVVEDEVLYPERILDRRPPWPYAFEEGPSEQIEVTLNDGSTIRGEFNKAAWDKNKQELYIEDPEQVRYTQSGELNGSPVDIGRSVLITKSALAYVTFTQEDPNTETGELFEESFETEMERISQEVGETLDEIRDQKELGEFEDEKEGVE